MTTLRTIVAAVMLVGGTSLAIAQNGPQTHNPANNQGTSKTVSENGPPMHGSDTVILSAAQRRAVWNDLSKQATHQNAARFNPAIGTFVPNNVKIEPMPSKVTAKNPSLRPYGFAMVDHKLVIADPSNKVIADVLSK